jgi:hypothetical protein
VAEQDHQFGGAKKNREEMLFTSDMPTHTHKNGALRAARIICLKMSQYFAFWPFNLAWLTSQPLKNMFGFRARDLLHPSLAPGRILFSYAAQTPAEQKTGCPRLLLTPSLFLSQVA